MSWMDCIDRALAAKRIKGKKADEARARYENLRREAMADGLDERAAEEWAAEQATQAIEIEKAEQKKRSIAQMKFAVDNYTALAAGGVKKLKDNSRALIEFRPGSDPNIIGYADRVERNRGKLQKLLDGFIEKYSPKFLGLKRTTAGMENIIRELFQPGVTGDASARAFAEAWTKTTDFGVRMWNYAGGTLRRLDEWRLPQQQSRIKLYKATKDVWVADHMGWLDWDKMRWPDGSRIEPADRNRVLGEVYDTLKTGGDIRTKPGTAARGKALGDKSDSRFLVYKDADSWLAMHDKYGEGNIFEVMMGHLDGMAHGLSMIQTFGPSPSTGLEQVKANMRHLAAEADAAHTSGKLPRHGIVPTTHKDEADAAGKWLDDAFKIISRANKAPENGAEAVVAGLLSDTRAFGTSALLGSAFLSAFTGDFATAAVRLRFARLPVWDTMKWYFRFMNPANKADVRLMTRTGIVNDAASRVAYGHVRATGLEAGGSRIGRLVSDVVLRASALNWHTQSARFATSAEFMGAMADWAGLDFEHVPLRRVFETHGITAAEWDAMRAVPVREVREGVHFLVPDDYVQHSGLGENGGMALADKFMVMIQQEAKLATLDATIAPIVAMRGATRSGTLVGEVANSFAMFRNFPLTLINTHIRAGLTMPTMKGKIGYLASLFAALTVMGGVGQQMYEVAQGRDPMAVDSAQFWERAVLRGGGLSVFGDIISAVQGADENLPALVAGPTIGFLGDLGHLVIGDTFAKISGSRNVNMGKDAVKFGQRWLPGGNIWYLRKALQVALWDHLTALTDTRGQGALLDQERRLKQRSGQSFWWRPGQLPDRGPDLSAVVQ